MTEKQEAYEQGYDAYVEGKSLSDNPYIGKGYNQWKEGWEMAKDDHREYIESLSPLRPEDYDQY